VFPWLCLAFGLAVGSFLNVVIHRLPKMMERDWREQCAELMRTGEPYPRAAGGGAGSRPLCRHRTSPPTDTGNL
jgi:leader peptidase (prepilin peptidase)/N-methyltransferase